MYRFALAVSLSHLFFLSVFMEYGAIQPWKTVSPVVGFNELSLWVMMMVSALVAPFLIGAAVWGVDTALRRKPHRWIRTVRQLAFLVLGVGALLALVNAFFRLELGLLQPVGSFYEQHFLVTVIVVIIVLIAALVTLTFSIAVREALVKTVRTSLVILAPTTLLSVAGILYVIVTILGNGVSLESSPERSLESQPVSTTPGLPKNIVVLLFDSFSYGAAFENQEISPELFNLRSLASQSLVFHDVRKFPGRTEDNVPIMLTGQIYAGSDFINTNVGDVAYLSDGTEVKLKEQRSVFDLAYEQGYQLATYGMYIDYCGTYVNGLGECRSTPFFRLPLPSTNFPEAFIDPYRSAINNLLPHRIEIKLSNALNLGLDGQRNFRQYTLRHHDGVIEALSEAEGFFIYAHYPFPHGELLRYDEETRALQSGNTTFDSFRVADSFVGEIRKALENSGRWDDTLLILVSDHNDEALTPDPRVLLILKLPNMNQRLDYTGPWTHAQFLPFLEELFDRQSFEPETVLAAVHKLAPEANVENSPVAASWK